MVSAHRLWHYYQHLYNHPCRPNLLHGQCQETFEDFSIACATALTLVTCARCLKLLQRPADIRIESGDER
jgi:hypothetical protein